MKITVNETLNCIKQDALRYKSGWKLSPGFWVTFSYRIRKLRKFGSRYLWVLFPFDIFLGCVRWWVSDSAISSSIDIGPGLYLPHPNGIFINHMAVLGSNVAIFQQVTIAEWQGSAAYIGDGSALYAGAKIIGGVSVGKNCKIGANTVVSVSVPDNTSVSCEPPLFRLRSKD
jgi:serine acetyltransferase